MIDIQLPRFLGAPMKASTQLAKSQQLKETPVVTEPILAQPGSGPVVTGAETAPSPEAVPVPDSPPAADGAQPADPSELHDTLASAAEVIPAGVKVPEAATAAADGAALVAQLGSAEQARTAMKGLSALKIVDDQLAATVNAAIDATDRGKDAPP
jgi:hypothetical protein